MDASDQTFKLELNMNRKEIDMMRNCLSDLGMNDPTAVSVQLKVANAILDTNVRLKQNKPNKTKYISAKDVQIGHKFSRNGVEYRRGTLNGKEIIFSAWSLLPCIIGFDKKGKSQLIMQDNAVSVIDE